MHALLLAMVGDRRAMRRFEHDKSEHARAGVRAGEARLMVALRVYAGMYR